MNPVQPRDDGRPLVVLGAGQSQYHQLVATLGDLPETELTTEWEPTAEELHELMNGGRVQMKTLTFGNKFSPVQLNVIEAP